VTFDEAESGDRVEESSKVRFRSEKRGCGISPFFEVHLEKIREKSENTFEESLVRAPDSGVGLPSPFEAGCRVTFTGMSLEGRSEFVELFVVSNPDVSIKGSFVVREKLFRRGCAG
jgi:hypothetical protein